ncbi:MAG: rhodanese-like domain-containing protein [Terracidiphilus sp.]|jgi:3-mercaptopyruvate sulfurtransferase SseA
MSSSFLFRRIVTIAALVLFCLAQQRARAAGQWAAPPPESALTIPAAQLIQPEELNRLLHTHGAEKPLILQVGSRMMFEQAHIPGAEYAGQGSQSEDIQQLRGRVAALPHKAFIVLYCGCCPWNRCPNVGPAFQLLQGMGFTHVKVLYLADNFGDDWVNKGYAVESGR